MTAPRLSAWRAVVGFGIVSLAGDMVYEGMRSVSGPLLASLGASALIVGLVTGAGEAASLGLRLVTGPLADRTHRYWALTILGYGMTAVCVPLLAVTPFIGGAGLVVASSLILIERAGKAIRSPSKTTLLADAAGAVGRGRGFGVHKALDEVGAFSGPLLVAGLLAWRNEIWLAMAVLAIPGAVAMGYLLWLRRRLPDPSVFDGAGARPRTASQHTWWQDTLGVGLGRPFFRFAAASSLATAGLVTFGVIAFHLTADNIVSLAIVPVIYAAAQAASAVAALVNGFGYDKVGPRTLYALPVLVALVPTLAFRTSALVCVAGVLCWGAANGLQDSTVKALVADLVVGERRATAYGVFAAIQGLAAMVGGVLAGALYADHLNLLIGIIAASQVATSVLLALTLRDLRSDRAAPSTHAPAP